MRTWLILLSRRHLLRCSRLVVVLLGHAPMGDWKIRHLLLLVNACVRCRSRGCSSLSVHRTGRISYVDQALRCPSDTSGAASSHVLRLCHYCVSRFPPLLRVPHECLELELTTTLQWLRAGCIHRPWR